MIYASTTASISRSSAGAGGAGRPQRRRQVDAHQAARRRRAADRRARVVSATTSRSATSRRTRPNRSIRSNRPRRDRPRPRRRPRSRRCAAPRRLPLLRRQREEARRVLSGGERQPSGACQAAVLQPSNCLLARRADQSPRHRLPRRCCSKRCRATAESIVLVAHDRHLLDRLPEEVIEVGAGQTIVRYLGNYERLSAREGSGQWWVLDGFSDRCRRRRRAGRRPGRRQRCAPGPRRRSVSPGRRQRRVARWKSSRADRRERERDRRGRSADPSARLLHDARKPAARLQPVRAGAESARSKRSTASSNGSSSLLDRMPTPHGAGGRRPTLIAPHGTVVLVERARELVRAVVARDEVERVGLLGLDGGFEGGAAGVGDWAGR